MAPGRDGRSAAPDVRTRLWSVPHGLRAYVYLIAADFLVGLGPRAGVTLLAATRAGGPILTMPDLDLSRPAPRRPVDDHLLLV